MSPSRAVVRVADELDAIVGRPDDRGEFVGSPDEFLGAHVHTQPAWSSRCAWADGRVCACTPPSSGGDTYTPSHRDLAVVRPRARARVAASALRTARACF